MSSATLLAADPHLTPVRARPALVFGGHDGRHNPTARAARPLRRCRLRAGAAPSRIRQWSRVDRFWRRARSGITGRRPIVLAALVMLVAAGLGTLRAWPPFAVVMSGSMAPTINTGDMVVLQRLREPARIGEIVAVPVPDDARVRYGYPPVVIHRVVRIIGDQIRTKGDARPTVDPFTVPRTAVDARVIAHIPAGGRVLAFFHSAPGLLWLLCGGVLFFGLPLLERARDARRQETAVSHDLVASVAGELARLQAEQERSRESAVEAVAQLDRLTQFIERAIADRPDVVPVATSSDVAADRMEPVRDAASSPVEPAPEGSGPSSPAPRAHITARCTAPTRPAVGSAVIAAAIQTRPEQRRSVPPAERWDAPPRSASTDSTGWAAPPSPMHSGRFHRSGRLVAASLVHAAAEA